MAAITRRARQALVLGFVNARYFPRGFNFPPFLKGGQGGLDKRLIIPLNPPLEKGDFSTSAQLTFFLNNIYHKFWHFGS